MQKVVQTVEGNFSEDIRKEDGGMAMISTICNDTEDGLLFVRVQSWDESEKPNHPEFNQFLGRRVKITIETID